MNNTLADFQSYLSESFYRRIYLLEKIIGNRHWLTTGTYKEKILLSFLNDALPGKFRAKPGFIVFPCNKEFKTEVNPTDYDYLNSSAYEISRQIDIIVYDQHNFSPIHDDNDLAIVGPESVHAIIEVKGSLSRKHLFDAVDIANDYSKKWVRYNKFRDERYIQAKLPKTDIFIFAWETKTHNGRRQITGKSARSILAKNLKEQTSISNYDTIPIIEKLLVYNDYEVDFIHYTDESQKSAGYATSRGQYIVFNNDGIPQKCGDKTIFSLLRHILSSNELLFNRFLIDSDETNIIDILPHKESGYSKVYDLD